MDASTGSDFFAGESSVALLAGEDSSGNDPCRVSVACPEAGKPGGGEPPARAVLEADKVTPAPAPPANSPPPIAPENIPLLNTLSPLPSLPPPPPPPPPPNRSSNNDLDGGGAAGCGDDADATVDGEDEDAGAGALGAVREADGSSLKPGGAGAGAEEATEAGGTAAPPPAPPRPPLLKKGFENMDDVSVEPLDAVRANTSCPTGTWALAFSTSPELEPEPGATPAATAAAAAPTDCGNPGAPAIGPRPGGCDRGGVVRTFDGDGSRAAAAAAAGAGGNVAGS